MKVIYGTGNLDSGGSKPKAVTVGVFDGVHRGHRRVLRHVRRVARDRRLVSAVVTFVRHPSHALGRVDRVRHLTSLKHKLILLEREGVDLCYVLPFDRGIARLTPDVFIRDLLVGRLKTAALFVGEDFVFGQGAKGDIGTLQDAARRYGFRFHALRHLMAGRRVISSTRIRAFVEKGDLKTAHRLLGRRVSLLGSVVRGEGRGRKLGYPTVNLCIEHEALVPDGVYATRARVQRGGMRFTHTVGGTRFTHWRPCVTYVGRKPTFHRGGGRVVEVFFWHERVGSLRGRLLEVEFIRSLRPERRFKGPQELVLQMGRDVGLAQSILKRFS